MAESSGSLELPNIITIVSHHAGDSAVMQFFHHFENAVFAGLVVVGLSVTAWLASRRTQVIPGPLQNAVECAVEMLDEFVCEVLGPRGRQFTPFIGTLFLYIFSLNMLGLVPGMKSPTSTLSTTVALAVCVLVYVQYTSIRMHGLLGYLDHLAGRPRPRSVLGVLLLVLIVPYNIVLHLVEELTKPLSLSMRLFGNIFGEDVLIAAFVGLGIMAVASLKSPVGVPFQVPFLFLAILTGTIQALVFTLLSTIYISLVLPEEKSHESREKGG